MAYLWAQELYITDLNGLDNTESVEIDSPSSQGSSRDALSLECVEMKVGR